MATHRLGAALLALLVGGTGVVAAIGGPGAAVAVDGPPTAEVAVGQSAAGAPAVDESPRPEVAVGESTVGGPADGGPVVGGPAVDGPADGGPAVAAPAVGETTAGAPAVGETTAGGPALPGPAGGVQSRARQGVCDFDGLYDQVLDSVVTVRAFDRQGDRGLGSGWVYEVDDSTALVVTNWHVVSRSTGADVRFSEGDWRGAAELLGVDPYSDLAVLRVEDVPEYVEALPISEQPPDQGDPVAAVGTPLGLEGSLTSGLISSVDRSVTVANLGTVYTVANAIQIDAAINPGNSGGPLLACDGDLVGVNFAGVDPATGENVNFAIAASTVQRVVPELVEDGTFNHSYLGVRVRTVTPTLARVNGLEPGTEGVLVESVVLGGPSVDVLRGSPLTERVTGLPLGGDVVVAVDGTEVDDVEALQDYLFDETRPGEEVTLTLLRDGERMEVTVVLDAKPLPPERPGRAGPST